MGLGLKVREKGPEQKKSFTIWTRITEEKVRIGKMEF